MEIDPTLAEARVEGRAVALSPAELRLLELLARRRGRPLPVWRLRDELAAAGEPTTPGALRARIARLRRKIEPAARPPRHLVYDPHEGYSLVDARLSRAAPRSLRRLPARVRLTASQETLLRAFHEAHGRPVTWQELAKALGRGTTARDHSAVRLALHRLGNALAADPNAPRVVNHRGVGYLLRRADCA